jgi:ABC-type Fe3+/spermidine/putrescine transport system ATPase subunit
MRKINDNQIQLRVAALLEQVNLSGFEKRNISELSGGEQQRVALARALAPQPRLLMFDEPLGALDKSLKDDLLNEIRSILHNENIPAIYVTHDAEEAFAIPDRILILQDGMIIRDDAPEKIWQNPKYVEVAKILGIGNVIEGQVIAKNKVKTEIGIFDIDCKKNKGEKVNLLITQQFPSPFRRGARGEVEQQINVKVEDIVYKQNQFEVKSRGAKFLIKKKPKIGETIKVNVQVQCLE